MKSLVLCACVLILAESSSVELKQLRNPLGNLKADIKACAAENDMALTDIYKKEDIMTKVYKEPENEERTRKNGCLIACILKKQNLMEGSNIKESQVHATINEIYSGSGEARNVLEALAHKIARRCMKKVRIIKLECEKAFLLFTCVMENVHKVMKHEEHEREETEEIEEATEAEHIQGQTDV